MQNQAAFVLPYEKAFLSWPSSLRNAPLHLHHVAKLLQRNCRRQGCLLCNRYPQKHRKQPARRRKSKQEAKWKHWRRARRSVRDRWVRAKQRRLRQKRRRRRKQQRLRQSRRQNPKRKRREKRRANLGFMQRRNKGELLFICICWIRISLPLGPCPQCYTPGGHPTTRWIPGGWRQPTQTTSSHPRRKWQHHDLPFLLRAPTMLPRVISFPQDSGCPPNKTYRMLLGSLCMCFLRVPFRNRTLCFAWGQSRTFSPSWCRVPFAWWDSP